MILLSNLSYAGILNYAMTKRYLEDINFALTTEKQIRFNQRQDRLYMDMDFSLRVLMIFL